MFMQMRGPFIAKRRRPKNAPTRDPAAVEALAAFDDADRAGLPSLNCYRAAVDAWRRRHPDQSAEQAAGQAVAVILRARISLRLPD
jgi:hypothetical protein